MKGGLKQKPGPGYAGSDCSWGSVFHPGGAGGVPPALDGWQLSDGPRSGGQAEAAAGLRSPGVELQRKGEV